MRTPLVIEALQQAAVTRGSLKGAVFHTDHGSVYTSKAFAAECKKLGVTQSMGAIGSSADNALAESMGATLKREVLMDARPWDDELTCRRQTFRRLNRARHRAPPLLLRPPTPNHLRETDLNYYAGNRCVNQPPYPAARNKAPGGGAAGGDRRGPDRVPGPVRDDAGGSAGAAYAGPG